VGIGRIGPQGVDIDLGEGNNPDKRRAEVGDNIGLGVGSTQVVLGVRRILLLGAGMDKVVGQVDRLRALDPLEAS